MKDLRVLVLDLTSRTPPYDRALCEALQDCGHDVVLWASGSHTDDFKNMDVPHRKGILDHATQISSLSAQATKQVKAVEYLINMISLTTYLWRKRPDILHVQWLPLLETLPIIELSFIRLCQYWGIQVVYTVHDLLPLEEGKKHYSTFYKVYNTVDRLICHTEEACDRLTGEFGVDSSLVWQIPHGTLLERTAEYSREEARRKQSLPIDRPITLLFGVLRPYKGVDILIDAWEKIETSIPEGILIIAGGGQEAYLSELKENINKSDALNIQTRFRFLPEKELSQLIAAADVLVYPYRHITQSGALLAGMSAGKAIVASRVGGLGETLENGKTGYLVEPNNPDELAEAITYLLGEPDEREKLGCAARGVVEEKYSWHTIAEKTTDCYEGRRVKVAS